jgi:hypothetical protein
VAELEPACRVTGLERQQFLVASHIKPWRDCDNSERLSGANGLLLSPHVDKLFDRHWISFDAFGELICEHEAAREALRCWGDRWCQPDPAIQPRPGAVPQGPSGSTAALSYAGSPGRKRWMNTAIGMGPQRGFQLSPPGIRRQHCTCRRGSASGRSCTR